MLLTDEIMKENCKRVLRRIAWRLQYVSKKRYTREVAMIEQVMGEDSMGTIVSQVYIEQLLHQLPDQARYIIKSIIIDGMTEEEVARKLKMTRQGVNKCKNKYLRLLAQKLSRSAR